ncbi:hypothetical protein [Micromonospora taraxaci]
MTTAGDLDWVDEPILRANQTVGMLPSVGCRSLARFAADPQAGTT